MKIDVNFVTSIKYSMLNVDAKRSDIAALNVEARILAIIEENVIWLMKKK